MIKKLPLSLVAALFAFASYGQTIVSTSPQNKNVVLEEFTGIYCQFCPEGHAIAQSIQDENPGRVSLINIHAGGFANPQSGHPDFRTDYGNAIANQSGLTGYPAGQVNRHVFPGRGMSNGGTAMGRGAWALSASEILDMPSYVNVGIEANLDLATRLLTIHVEAYYTGDSPESTNLLNVAVLQNNTKGPQSGGGAGNNYNHMHRLVDLITGQWGEEITTTTAGSFVDRTFTYTVPADYRGVEAVLEDMEVAAFITETQQEIPSGSSTKPYFTGVTLANDVNIRSIQPIDPTCGNTISPVVNVKNEGQNPITELAITYEVNGDSQVYNWTGNIPALWDENIELPEITFNLQETNTLNISVPTDEDNTNNSQSLSFDKASEGSGTIKIRISTDNWGYEFSWELRDSQGNVVESGDGYPNGNTTYVHLDLAADCYTIHLFDEYGDGGTLVVIEDHDGNRLLTKTGNWGAHFEGEFSSNGILNIDQMELGNINIYPNPTHDVLNITNAENADIQIFDTLGKMILSKDAISANEQLNVSGLNAGIYFIQISKEGNVTNKKVIINN